MALFRPVWFEDLRYSIRAAAFLGLAHDRMAFLAALVRIGLAFLVVYAWMRNNLWIWVGTAATVMLMFAIMTSLLRRSSSQSGRARSRSTSSSA